MTKEQAQKIIGNRPKWELKNMQKALTILPFFNTPQDNKRLQAVETLLKNCDR